MILVWLASPKVEWYIKSSTKNIVHELPHKLLNKLGLTILGNLEIMRKNQK